MIRIQGNYERLKDTDIMKYHVMRGDLPKQEDTGMDSATYKKLVDAIRYGQQVESSLSEDLSTGIDDIKGLKTKTSTMKDGATLIEVEEDKQNFPADSMLPSR